MPVRVQKEHLASEHDLGPIRMRYNPSKMRFRSPIAFVLLFLVSCRSDSPQISSHECCYSLCYMPLDLFQNQLMPRLIADGIDCESGLVSFGLVTVEVRGGTSEGLKARERLLNYATAANWQIQWFADTIEFPKEDRCPEGTHSTSTLTSPSTQWVRIAIVEYRTTPTQALLSYLIEKGIVCQAWLGSTFDVVIVKKINAAQAIAEIRARHFPGVQVCPP